MRHWMAMKGIPTGLALTLLLAGPAVHPQVLSGVLSSNWFGYDGTACGGAFPQTAAFSTFDGNYVAGDLKSLSVQGRYDNAGTVTHHSCSVDASFSANYDRLRASLSATALRESGYFGFIYRASAWTAASDRIQVRSNSLPPGTPVQLTVVRDFHWAGHVTYSSNNQVWQKRRAANPCFEFHITDLLGNQNPMFCTFPDADGVALPRRGQRVFVQTVSTVVGQWFEVGSMIDLQATPAVSGVDDSHAATQMGIVLRGDSAPMAEARTYILAPAGVQLKADSGFKYKCPTRYEACAP